MILLQTVASKIAKLLIQSYQWLLQSLYGEREETYTCHALGHLPNQVFKQGPLILHSSFEQFHGTRGIVAQIVRNLLFAQNFGSFIKETQEPQEVKMFIEENIMGKKEKAVHTLGSSEIKNLSIEVVLCLGLKGQQVHRAERWTVKFFIVWCTKGERRVVVISWSSGNVATPNAVMSIITCLQGTLGLL